MVSPEKQLYPELGGHNTIGMSGKALSVFALGSRALCYLLYNKKTC